MLLNTTNKEAYVTFKVAEMLKKEGFNWKCITVYIITEVNPIPHILDTLSDYNNGKVKYCISCPTQQMACDYVEKMCGFFIEISRSIDLNGKYHYFYIILDKTCKYASSAISDNDYSNKSDAIEAALEYALTNLI